MPWDEVRAWQAGVQRYNEWREEEAASSGAIATPGVKTAPGTRAPYGRTSPVTEEEKAAGYARMRALCRRREGLQRLRPGADLKERG